MTIRKFLIIEVSITVALSVLATILTLSWSPHDPGEGFARLNMLFFVALEDIFVVTFLIDLLGKQSENPITPDAVVSKVSFLRKIRVKYGSIILFGAILVPTILYIIARVSTIFESYSALYN